jgi:hypothetical protein
LHSTIAVKELSQVLYTFIFHVKIINIDIFIADQNHTVWNNIDNLNAKQINETNNMMAVSNISYPHKKLTNGHQSSFVAHHDPLYVNQSVIVNAIIAYFLEALNI